jgi:hypothetical protein
MTFAQLPLSGGAVEYPNFAAFPPGVGSQALAWDSAGTAMYFDSPLAATWVLVASSSGGEANTGANVNLTGVGVFESKTGVQLGFRGITAASSKLSVALNVGNKSIDVDVVESNLSLASIGGTLGFSQLAAGTANAVSVFDGSGVLTSFNELNRTAEGGLALSINFNPSTDVGTKQFFAHSTVLGATANQTGQFYRADHYLQVSGANDYGDIINQRFNTVFDGSGDIAQFASIVSQSNLGDGTGPQSMNNAIVLDAGLYLFPGLTAQGVFVVNSYGNIDSATIQGYTAVNANPAFLNTAVVTGSVSGMTFSPSFSAASTVNGFNHVYTNPSIDCALPFFNGSLINGYGTGSIGNYIGYGSQLGGSVDVTNYQGFAVSTSNTATIDTFTGLNINSSSNGDYFTGANIGTTSVTLANDWNGVTIYGTGTVTGNVTGLSINVTGLTATGTSKAINAQGDVEISGQFNAFRSLTKASGPTPGFVDAGHLLITSPNVAANAALTNADFLGVNTAMLLNIGANASVSTFLLGVAALGLPAVVNMSTGSTIDSVCGAAFAISLDAAATGGTIDVVSLCKSVSIPNGATTVTKLRAYDFQQPFGWSGDMWGVYMEPDSYNWMKGSLKVGGTAGSTDKVTNSSIEIEATSKAIRFANIDTTARNALTALAGMVIFNTDTNKLQCYDGTSWQDLF